MKKIIAITALIIGLLCVSSAQAYTNIEFVPPRHQQHPTASIQFDSGPLSECVPTFGKVVFEVGGQQKMFYAQNICDARWVETNVTRLFVWTWNEEYEGFDGEVAGTKTEIELNLESGRDIPPTEYRVTAQVGEQIVHRVLTAKADRNGYKERVWWGSDAFVNYCINEGKELRSFHHRLFCWHYWPSTGIEQLRWHQY